MKNLWLHSFAVTCLVALAGALPSLPKTCGKNMEKTDVFPCDRVCNGKQRSCAKFSSNSKMFCACKPGYVLYDLDSNFCVLPKNCPKVSSDGSVYAGAGASAGAYSSSSGTSYGSGNYGTKEEPFSVISQPGVSIVTGPGYAAASSSSTTGANTYGFSSPGLYTASAPGYAAASSTSTGYSSAANDYTPPYSSANEGFSSASGKSAGHSGSGVKSYTAPGLFIATAPGYAAASSVSTGYPNYGATDTCTTPTQDTGYSAASSNAGAYSSTGAQTHAAPVVSPYSGYTTHTDYSSTGVKSYTAPGIAIVTAPGYAAAASTSPPGCYPGGDAIAASSAGAIAASSAGAGTSFQPLPPLKPLPPLAPLPPLPPLKPLSFQSLF